MIITDVKRQKNDENRFSVFVDGEYAFSLIASDIEYFKIKQGSEISEEKFKFITDTIVYIKAQDTALKYLSHKMRTEKEVRSKLSESDYSQPVIERVIEFLKKYNYVDDYEYSMAYIRQTLKLNPQGKYGIKHKLKMYGIDEKIIDLAIHDSEIDEEKYIKMLVDKKIRTLDITDDKGKRKLQDFLLRKGYSYDIIKEVIDSYIKENIES